LGLTPLRERAEAIGGRLSVTSAPGRGTTVRVLLPPATVDIRPFGAPAAPAR
ncbi:MAG: hypothetical protein HGA45_25545, partial [Chloroflexales bacterium]|nr:hypothetical protein [Chloroflexales bacterium]